MPVNFIPAKCPQCKGDLQLPDNIDTAHCVYCGCTIIIDKSKDASVNIENLIKLAGRELKAKDWQRAIEYCDQALYVDPDNDHVLHIYINAMINLGFDLFEEGFRISEQIDRMPRTQLSVLDAFGNPVITQMKTNSAQQEIMTMNDLAARANSYFDEAMRYFEKALSLDQKNVSALYGKAEVLLFYRGGNGQARRKQIINIGREIFSYDPEHKPMRSLLNKYFRCPKCQGSGQITGLFSSKTCPLCRGTGKDGKW